MTQLYKKITFFTVLFISCMTFAQALPERFDIITQKTLSNFHFFEDKPWLASSKKIYLNDLIKKQEIIIIYLWSTSCVSCVAELDELEEISREYMNDPINFVVLSLNDPRPGVLRNYFKRKHYSHLKPYHRASDMQPQVNGLPTTLFIDKNGNLFGQIEGVSNWHSKEMKQLLDYLIKTKYKAKQSRLEEIFSQWIKKLKALFS